MDEAVRIEGLTVSYGGATVLENVSLSVGGSDFLGIIGPNGGGKTTLLKAMLGLVKPDRGTISLFGRSVDGGRRSKFCLATQPKPRRGGGRRFVGYVPQYTQFDTEYPATVMDVVLMGRIGKGRLVRRYSKEDYSAARAALAQVELSGYEKRQIGELSGGERQRALIARAICSRPKLLLLDEPTASIDRKGQTDVYELLSRLKRDMAIIMVSHDIGAVSVYVDKVACLNRKLYYHGDKELRHDEIEEAYACPVELLFHGAPHEVPHRALREHEDIDLQEMRRESREENRGENSKENREAASHQENMEADADA
ncbi:MAG: ABC transporter [Thermoplasmata archaeon HGW-Thermoplasmata-1]|nr:MAG: ABC transporter [Thermoplasmata archaeon HGW-Thermoplasmata-1]